MRFNISSFLYRRIQSNQMPEHIVFHDLPNAIDFLNSTTSQPQFPPSIYDHLNSIHPDQRQHYVKSFGALFEYLPATFYPRTSVAFFIFLECYRHCLGDNNHQTGGLSQELQLWMETFILLIAASLTKTSSKGSASTVEMAPLQETIPLHHILSVLLLSTRTFVVFKACPEICTNFRKALKRLQLRSSGATQKWLTVLVFKMEDKDVSSGISD